jgi:hypothetical protein
MISVFALLARRTNKAQMAMRLSFVGCYAQYLETWLRVPQA